MKLYFNRPSILITSIIILCLPISLGVFYDNLDFNISIADFILPIGFLQAFVLYFRNNDFSPKQNKMIKYIFIWVILFLLLLLLSIFNLLLYDGIFVDYFKNFIIDFLKIFICSLYVFTFTIDFFYFKNQMKLNKILKICCFSLFLFSFFCVLGYVLYFFGVNNPFVQHGFRARGTMLDTNLAACFILTFMFFPLYAFVTTRKKIYLLILLSSILALLFTCSKAGIITLAISSVVIMLYLLFFKPIVFKRIFPLLLLIILIFILLFNYTNLFDSFFKRMNELNDSSLDDVMTGRNIIWKIAFDILFRLDPKNSLKGIGLGLFKVYERKYYFDFLFEGKAYVVHNTFLSLWVEAGFFVFLLVLLSFILLLCKLSKKAVVKKNELWITMLFSFLSLFIYMNSVSMQNNRFVYVFCIFVTISLFDDSFRVESIKIEGDLK